MKYRVETYCRDCYGEDDKGCFDGRKEIDEYDTLEEATASVKKTESLNSLMECKIFDEDDNEIEVK